MLNSLTPVPNFDGGVLNVTYIDVVKLFPCSTGIHVERWI
jgi:hypothetical protein